ncbi:UNVERIFIED_CONTAM: hypothetical protein GTU68_052551, partial [Idotea baltica]|nr:hypothetical protein [Idotea baltica]
RPSIDNQSLRETVSEIISKVRDNGDSALKEYAKKFDGIDLDQIEVSKEEINSAESKVDDNLKKAIEVAFNNITKFHESQKEEVKKIETTKGVTCWRKSVGIEKVGLYIPGGTAPLISTVLMLAIPAKLAGCKKIILSTPSKETVHPAILYAAKLTGIDKIYQVGGAQSIAAMALGTDTIEKVDKIFGPGNQYVTMAKQIVTELGTSIDLPAGPSEVLVYADSNADPEFIAADLLSQAEHGNDSQVIFITTDKNILDQTEKEVNLQGALKNSKLIYLDNESDCIDLMNSYAPEHLILACRNNEEISEKVINSGSIFLGNLTPESAGDYASGTNHTLPTNGYARAYSGVSLDSFVKKITFQKITEEGLKELGPIVEILAEAESLTAHKNAVTVRLNKIK